MPSLICNSNVCAVSDHCNLTLHIEHRIDLGRPSDAPRQLNSAALLKSIDVLLASELVITLSGSHDATKVSSEDVAKSRLAMHLVEYLRMNATRLGLGYVSGIIHDRQDDAKPKVIIRPGRPLCLQLQTLPTCANLTRLDLAYTWGIPPQGTGSQVTVLTYPFAQTLSLPYLALLNDVVERFVKFHLVKRYPLIFGSWRKQLEIETDFCISIYRSIRSIIDRSDNHDFKEKCKQLFMAMKENLLTSAAGAAAALADDEDDTTCPQTSFSDMDALCLAMERLFQSGMQPSKFQLSRLPAMSDSNEDEQLSQNFPTCPAEELQDGDQKILSESPPESPLLASIDSIGNHSSFANFPFGLYDHQIHTTSHQKSMEQEVITDQGTHECVNDFGLLDDNTLHSQDSQTYGSVTSSLTDRVRNDIYPESVKRSPQGVGDSVTSSAASHADGHLMQKLDLCEDTLSIDVITYSDPIDHLMDDDEWLGDSSLTVGNDFQQDDFSNRGEWPIDDLFAQDGDYGIKSDLEGFDALTYESSDDLDLGNVNDGDFLSRNVPESETGTLSSMELNGDMLQEDVIQHVPSLSLSEPHFTRHAPSVSSTTCSRADQKECHDRLVDGSSAQFKTGELRSTVCDQVTGSELNLEGFIELEVDWDTDEDILNLID